MRTRVGNASLGWLCLLAGGLWLAYKHEFVSLLLQAWGNPDGAAFDHAVEIRVLVFILSPGLILAMTGIAMLLSSLISRPRTPGGPAVAK